MLPKYQVYGPMKRYITLTMNVYINHNEYTTDVVSSSSKQKEMKKKFREMDLTPDHKKDVEKKLVQAVIDALEGGHMTAEEADIITPFIYSEMTTKVKTHEDLMSFLRVLSSKSPIFSYLLVTESGEVRDKEDKEVANKAEDLIKTGNLDQAIEMIKEANNG